VLLFLVPPWVGTRRQATWDDQARAACGAYVVAALHAPSSTQFTWTSISHTEPLYTVTGSLAGPAGAAPITFTCQAVHRSDDVFDVSGVSGLPR
jgi:hypothetical protein